MKETLFLKKKPFVSSGIFDNINIYENTIEAYNLAIDKDMGLYLTIRETKDNKIICFNDENLSRYQNLKDKISDTKYEELEFLSNYHIPLLEEALKTIDGKVPIILNLSINSKNKIIFNLLDNYKGDFAVISNHNKILSYIIKNKPTYIVGEIITKRPFKVSSLFIKPDFKSYNIKYFDSIKLKKLKENGIFILGYLLDTPIKYSTYKDEFDNIIISNYHDLKMEG